MADDTKEKEELKKMLAERFAALPSPVKNAITSADVEKEMRKLAERHKLHLDQWEALENNVLMTLLGFKEVGKLADNIKSEVGVDTETAAKITTDISLIVFEPIREELERELEHPEAKQAEVSGVEAARTQELGTVPSTAAPPTPAVAPATPPAAPPEGKIERAPISAAYKAGEASTVRKSVDDDPYREPPQ